MGPGKGSGRERGVSPVIGIVLLVAVTVAIGAVAATYAFGLTGDSHSFETAEFNFDYTEEQDRLVVTHMGGDSVEAGSIEFQGALEEPKTWAELDPNADEETMVVGGDAVGMDVDHHQDDEVRIVFTDDDRIVTDGEVPWA